MDLRMFGRGYEDLYYEAQSKYGIRFIRGRVSEVAEDFDEKVVIKAEDTLQSKPLKITLDLLVLMVGMRNSDSSKILQEKLGLKLAQDGFFENSEKVIAMNYSNKRGIFFAGTSTGPKSIPETLNDARGTALLVHHYLQNQ
jgi:heterodisulfide reductase subunit A